MCSYCVFIIVYLQSNEVGGSCYMEKQGLKQALSNLNDCDVHVDILVTDRHAQIKKFIREEHQEIKHYFDVWHIAKGNYNIRTVLLFKSISNKHRWIYKEANIIWTCFTTTKQEVIHWIELFRMIQCIKVKHVLHCCISQYRYQEETVYSCKGERL